MKLLAVIVFVVAASGCSSSFQCRMSGVSCPAGTQQSGGAPASDPEPSTATSEQPPAAAAQPSSPAPKDCLATGTKTDNYHKCCSETAKSQIEPDPNIFTCG
jgi:hypothetical protein